MENELESQTGKCSMKNLENSFKNDFIHNLPTSFFSEMFYLKNPYKKRFFDD